MKSPELFWRTQVDPEYAAQYGVHEAHILLFAPINDRAGSRDTVTLQIPEASIDQILESITLAHRHAARLLVVCNTRAQAEKMAAVIIPKLEDHRRVPYEKAIAGAWGQEDA